MSEDIGWVAPLNDDPEGASDGPPRPPIWVVGIVVLSLVAGVWLLVSQGSTDIDSATGSTTSFTISTVTSVTPDDVSVVTSTTSLPTAAAPVRSVYGSPPASVVADTPHELAGFVAVTAPDPPFGQGTVWVFRPGGSLVSRTDVAIGGSADEYPMLITAGALTLAGRILDVDLVEPPISLWTNGSVFPGSSPGLVWLERRVERTTGDSLWVSPVDIESLTVGERIEVTDLFSRAIVGVADGLVVVPVEQPPSFSQDELAYWSPTDGLVPLDLPGEIDTVVAASGDVVVVASTGRVRFLDVTSGEYMGSVELLDIRGPVTSACLSPDGQHVIVVGWNGEALVANTTTGETMQLLDGPSEYQEGAAIEYPLSSVQPKHGIGWTANDQLVVIAEVEDTKHILGIDVATGEYVYVAALTGSEDWWLTASGTMC